MKYKRIVILGDLHLQEKEPFKSSAKRVLDWILSNDTINNNEVLFIHLGDFFDEKTNNGSLNEIALRFYSALKNKTKIQVIGNHEGDKTGNALEAIKVVEGVELISEPTKRIIGDKSFLFLPHIYTDSEGVTMEDRYSNLHNEDRFKNMDYDYCLAHIMDETKSFHKKTKVCNLTNLEIKQRVFGHDHNFNLDDGGNYLGSVQPNSSTEKDKTPKIYVIDLEKNEDYTIDVPLFINYYSVTYPDSLPEMNVDYPVLNIHESLDKNESIDFYMKEAKSKGIENLTINRVFRKRLMNDKKEIENEGDKVYVTDSEYFENLVKEKELSSGVADIVRKVIA